MWLLILIAMICFHTLFLKERVLAGRMCLFINSQRLRFSKKRQIVGNVLNPFTAEDIPSHRRPSSSSPCIYFDNSCSSLLHIQIHICSILHEFPYQCRREHELRDFTTSSIGTGLDRPRLLACSRDWQGTRYLRSAAASLPPPPIQLPSRWCPSAAEEVVIVICALFYFRRCSE